MAIRNFAVGARRGLVAASASELPNIVAIAGPNGAGKSALLEQLWQQRTNLLETGSEALYVGPNRTWRAGTLNDLAARAFTTDYEQVLKAEALPGFQIAPGGLSWLSGMSRFGSNADDAQALVKTAIVRIHNRSERYIATEFLRQGNKIDPGTVKNLLEPLRILIDTLLPHLMFHGVDSTDTNNVRVLFSSRLDVARRFDIDDLSSGEKAAIALFLPLIERQVRELVGELASHSVAPGIVPLTLLLDEPEIHLHPLLQLNVLEYMRRIAGQQSAQFIFTTHSPTLLDALSPEELFLLSPSDLAVENQLTRLGHSVEKLEIARALTGGTHTLTRGKPIVFVEGEAENPKTASDSRIFRLLAPQAEHWAIIPSHGKGQVITSVASMRSAELSLPGMPVFGLVDDDQGSGSPIDYVVSWPVAMVENLLLDPDAISAVLQAYVPGISRVDVEHKLRAIARGLREEEIRVRVQAQLPARTLRPRGILEVDVRKNARAQADDYLKKLDEVDMESIITSSTEAVDLIIASGEELERFRGKSILADLFTALGVQSTTLSRSAFSTEIARQAATMPRVRRLIDGPLEKIRLYMPQDLIALLSRVGSDAEVPALAVEVEDHRGLWEEGHPKGDGRESLRDRLTALGRRVRDAGDPTGAEIIRSAAGIGTRS